MARPLVYKTAAEMQVKIDEYFELNKDRPWTISGLAYHLGLSSRQALINYKGRSKEFNDAITRARLKCETYAEERLFDRDGQRGAEFSLRCNFGWNDKVQEDGDTEKLDAILGAIKSEAHKA